MTVGQLKKELQSFDKDTPTNVTVITGRGYIGVDYLPKGFWIKFYVGDGPCCNDFSKPRKEKNQKKAKV